MHVNFGQQYLSNFLLYKSVLTPVLKSSGKNLFHGGSNYPKKNIYNLK
jgi:hypothetical protein